MNPRTTADLNKILKTSLVTGATGVGIITLLNALSDIKDSFNKVKLEDQLDKMSKPYNIVKIDPRYIKEKSRILNKDLKDAIADDIKKSASENINESAFSPTTTKALQYILGSLSAVAGGVIANKLRNKIKQQALKSELEDAKDQYYTSLYMRKRLEELNEEQNKDTKSMYRYASEDENSGEIYKYAGMLSSVLGGGLAAIVGAAIAHMILARNLANAKNPVLNRSSIYDQGLSTSDLMSPRLKFVIEGRPNKAKRNGSMNVEDSTGKNIEELEHDIKPDDVIDISQEKLASILDYDALLFDEACEGVIKMAAELELKSNSNGSVNDIITSVALGNIDPLHEAKTFNEMCDIARDFRESTKKVASEQRKSLAVSYIVQDPIIGSMFIPYSAAEVLEHNETFNKVASVLDDNEQASSDALINVALYNLKNKQELFSKKSSCNPEELSEFLKVANNDDNYAQDMKLLIKNILENKIEVKDF